MSFETWLSEELSERKGWGYADDVLEPSASARSSILGPWRHSLCQLKGMKTQLGFLHRGR